MTQNRKMGPDTVLTIYEIRAAEGRDLDFLAGPPEPEERFGPDLKGLHFEEDFAFLFFVNDFDLSPLLAEHSFLEVRQIHRLRYDQWQDGAGLEPLTIGPLNLLPPGRAVPAEGTGEGLTIIIDPGLAFGFGGHPTTRACLRFLVRLLRPGALETKIPSHALDLGTGTGVLALAAARLGVEKIIGVDHSHLAARCAQNNVKINNLSQNIQIFRGLAQDYAAQPGELVMANMPLFVLKELIDLGAFKNRDYVIFSGLLPSEGEIFLKNLALNILGPVKVIDTFRDDRWVSGLLDLRA
jgi:ribosomal protein L11 methyltransferase